jgi:hypothetical protein
VTSAGASVATPTPRGVGRAWRAGAAALATVLLAAPRLAAAQGRPADSTARVARSDTVPRAPMPADSALARDSLAARLERAEATIRLLQQQLAGEAATAVRARSRVQLELFARVVTNTFRTAGRVNNLDVPQWVLPTADGEDSDDGEAALGLTLRQTRLGTAVTVREVLGGTFDGDVEFDLFGGVQSGPGDRRLFPEPRLRLVRAWLRWPRTAVMVGTETPLISDLHPVSLAAVGVPQFATAGNLWNWLPQVRIARELGGRGVRWAAQGAVLTPFTGAQYAGDVDAVDAGERSGRPFLESRLAARWGGASEGGGTASDADVGDETSEVGVGLHRGWVAARDGRLLASTAVAIDARLLLPARVELRGEAYQGRLVRGLGGGGIGQNFGRPAAGETVGPPVRDVAGWAQINVRPQEGLVAGAGCGGDRARDADRPVRRRNVACALHVLWRPAQPLVIGAEYRRLGTLYDSGSYTANHLNLALGFEL